jgi:hypothetical protein
MSDQFEPINAAPAPEKKTNTTMIIIIVVLVLLCCCCVSVLGLAWTFGDQLLQMINQMGSLAGCLPA